MTHEILTPPLSRPLRLDRFEPDASGAVEATKAEMASVAALLELPGLENLRLCYRLKRGAAGRVHLAGRLSAHVAQTCVVSLEPVESDLDVPVEIEFWPEEAVEQLAKAEDELGGAGALDWPEPIREGVIDLGPVIYETLATSLDPYPRKEGASFDWSHDAAEPPGHAASPFAALQRLKRP